MINLLPTLFVIILCFIFKIFMYLLFNTLLWIQIEDLLNINKLSQYFFSESDIFIIMS